MKRLDPEDYIAEMHDPLAAWAYCPQCSTLSMSAAVTEAWMNQTRFAVPELVKKVSVVHPYRRPLPEGFSLSRSFQASMEEMENG